MNAVRKKLSRWSQPIGALDCRCDKSCMAQRLRLEVERRKVLENLSEGRTTLAELVDAPA